MTRPEAIPGATMTVRSVEHSTELGSRQRTGRLQVDLKASLGQEFAFELDPQAEVTSLLMIIPVAAVGVARQRSYGNVRVRDGLVVGALSPLGVVVGVVVANEVPPRMLELGFAALATLFAFRLAQRALTPAER